MSIPSEILAAGSAIIAAIVGGVVAFIVSVLSKEQKTSEFRQAWIDALRNEIADYVSKNIAFIDAVDIHKARESSRKELREFILDDRFVDVLGIEAARARIILRLNPYEHKTLITLVNNVYGRSGVFAPDSYASASQRIEALLSESQQLLKGEWSRVKTGEPIFYWTKWLSLVLAISGLIVIAIFLSGHVLLVYAP